jgi:hypothetical protein
MVNTPGIVFDQLFLQPTSSSRVTPVFAGTGDACTVSKELLDGVVGLAGLTLGDGHLFRYQYLRYYRFFKSRKLAILVGRRMDDQ